VYLNVDVWSQDNTKMLLMITEKTKMEVDVEVMAIP
jgi:hypothetical protein